MRIVVVVPTYERPELLWGCLHSISQQDDPDFDVIVADDGSTDFRVVQYMNEWGSWASEAFAGTWWSAYRPRNVGAVRNLTEVIRSFAIDTVAPDDVIFVVDGDDAIPPHAVSTIRALYEREAVVTNATYGSYESRPFDPSCPPAWRIPSWVLDSGQVREYVTQYGQAFNHPLTFRRWCFDNIADDELQIDGKWMRYGYDLAFFVPILEMCGNTAWFCPESLYLYTSNRAESVARLVPEETTREYAHVLAQPKCHEPIA